MNDNQKQSSSSNTSGNTNEKDLDSRPKKRIPLTPSKEKPSYPKKPSFEISRENYKNDGLKISPLFLIGGFIAALGAGFFLGPSSGPVSTSNFQAWSLVFIGLILAIIGAIQMFLDYLKQKKKKN